MSSFKLQNACLFAILYQLELDFSKQLDEHDPIIKLNLLAKKKRKNADDLHDYFKSTKSQRKDFISIEDFEELNN
ncbi:hypothetical protein Tco_0634857 [Tanacetum coccineum]